MNKIVFEFVLGLVIGLSVERRENPVLQGGDIRFANSKKLLDFK
jgi:hypothetical protein